MSTLALHHEQPTPRCAPAAPAPAAVRHVGATPNYALRRGVVGVVLVALVAALGLAGSTLASFGGDPAAAAETRPAAASSSASSVHVVRPGDTLWSIAHDHRGDIDHDRFVDALLRLNGGSTIQVGQAVLLP